MNHARAVGMVAILILSGCSHKPGAQSATTSVTPSAPGTAPGSSASGAGTVPPPTTITDIRLPPADPAAIAPTKATLADPGTSGWLTAALSETHEAAADVCNSPPAVMGPTVAANVTTLGDVVLSELLVNLDSALGGIGLACGNADTATAASELADAQAAANAITVRLDELNR
jgi:hypothetical protein